MESRSEPARKAHSLDRCRAGGRIGRLARAVLITHPTAAAPPVVGCRRLTLTERCGPCSVGPRGASPDPSYCVTRPDMTPAGLGERVNGGQRRLAAFLAAAGGGGVVRSRADGRTNDEKSAGWSVGRCPHYHHRTRMVRPRYAVVPVPVGRSRLWIPGMSNTTGPASGRWFMSHECDISLLGSEQVTGVGSKGRSPSPDPSIW